MNGTMQLSAALIRRGGLAFCTLCSAAIAQEDGFVAHRLVALRSISFMPDVPARLFRRHADQFLAYAVAPGVSWPRDAELKRRNAWHHVDADAGAGEQNRQARLAAFQTLPRGKSAALRWYRRHGPNIGGELPWAVVACHQELADAFRTGDNAAALAWAGYLAHFVADATNPFRCSENDQGTATGNLRFGSAHGVHPRSRDHSIRERFGAGLVARHASDHAVVRGEHTIEAESELVPLTSIFALIEGSLGVLDDVVRADGEILRRLGVVDRKTFIARADAYYVALHERCGAISLARLEAGASLTGRLIAHAWRAGGRPATLIAGTEPLSDWVASKNSDVFHKSTCPFVALINQENVVTFPTRDSAVSAGHRPCKRCQSK